MIVYIHVPGFYAAVEQADDPALRGRAVIVGGDPRKRGNVTGASREARRAGVSEGLESRLAVERCPDAVLRPTRLKRYREVAAEVREILRDAADRIEPLGLDGTFLEPPDKADALALCAELCVRIQADLALPCVGGIGPTRFVAYLAAAHPAPGGIRRVEEADALDFLAGFPVTEIWGLGPATAERLAGADVHKIGDLQPLSVETLRELCGRNAATFEMLAHAQDRDPLRASPRAKSLSSECTLAGPTVDLRTLGDEIGELARQLEAALARERRVARRITLGVYYVDGTHVSRTQTLQVPAVEPGQIADLGLQLLQRTQASVRPARRLRLQVSLLGRADHGADPRQLRLF